MKINQELLPYKYITTVSDSFNNYHEFGIYYLNNCGSWTNCPKRADRDENPTNGWLIVLNVPSHSGNSAIKQIMFRHGSYSNQNGYQMFVRTSASADYTIWQAWQEIMTSHHLYYGYGEKIVPKAGYAMCAGHITSNSKEIYFSIPLSKRVPAYMNLTSDNFKASVKTGSGWFNIIIRTSQGGYVYPSTSGMADYSDYINGFWISGEDTLNVKLLNSKGWKVGSATGSAVTNNSVVIADVSYNAANQAGLCIPLPAAPNPHDNI